VECWEVVKHDLLPSNSRYIVACLVIAQQRPLYFSLLSVHCLGSGILMSGHKPRVGSAPRHTDWLTISRNINLLSLARSQFASRRSCDRPTWSRFSVVFLSPRANTGLVPKFNIALYASHAAPPMVTLKILPYTNESDFDFGLDHPFQGGYGWGDLALQVGEFQMRQ
jgi:hypothetical protein